jgi:predicted MFS family arabinose efflux permease
MTSERNRAQPYLVVFALWLVVFSVNSQTMIIAPMLPQIGERLEIPQHLQGLLVSAYAVLAGLVALAAGPISDKVGRRRILLAGTSAMTVALALHASASSYGMLLALRAMAGSAGGILSGSSVSYISDYFPYERRGWAQGWVMSSTALAQILGVPLGTLLSGRFGFQIPFLMFAATMAAAFTLIWFFVPQPNVRRAEGALTVRRALSSYAALLRAPETRAGAAAFAAMLLGVSLYVIYLPTWLTTERGATSNEIASIFLAGGVASALTSPVAGSLSDRFGRRKLVILSCLGLALTVAATTWAVGGPWAAYPLFVVVMIFIAARTSPFQTLLGSLAPDGQRATLLSMSVCLGQISYAAGGALSGPLFARLGYRSNTLLSAAAVLVMAGLVSRYLPEPQARGVGSAAKTS